MLLKSLIITLFFSSVIAFNVTLKHTVKEQDCSVSCSDGSCCPSNYLCACLSGSCQWCVLQGPYTTSELIVVGIILGYVEYQTGFSLSCFIEQVNQMENCLEDMEQNFENSPNNDFTNTATNIVEDFGCVAQVIANGISNCNTEPWYEQLFDEVVDITIDALEEVSIVGEVGKILVAGYDITEGVIDAYNDWETEDYVDCGVAIGKEIIPALAEVCSLKKPNFNGIIKEQ